MQRRKNLKYIFPSLVTFSGLTLGLASILCSISGEFEWAGWIIVWCVLADKLDGTVARVLKATSEIGMQLDSLSDFVTFGLAPSFLVLMYWRHEFPDHPLFWGVYVVCALYVCMTALRLARFNVASEDIGDDVFLGLPTTMAGGFNTTLFLTFMKYGVDPVLFELFPVYFMIFMILMHVSWKLPKVTARKTKWVNTLQAIAAILSYVVAIFRVFPEYLLMVLTIYFIFGFGSEALKSTKTQDAPSHVA